MLDYILAFFRPNLTKVLGNFQKAIADLEKIEQAEAERQAKAIATIAQAEATRFNAAQTAARAATVKSNLNNLIGE